MRRPDGVTVIAIYHFLVGVLGLFGACAIVAFPIAAVVMNVDDPTALFWSLLGLGIGLVAAGGFGLAALLVGWGLLQLHNWARWAAIVLAIVQLPAFPIGTIIGGLIIWYLLQPEARQTFERPSPTPL